MANKSGKIGTEAETGVVNVQRAYGFPGSDRRRLSGGADNSDAHLGGLAMIDGIPGWAESVKGGAAARHASLAQVEAWQAEVVTQSHNAGAGHALLVVARAGYAPARAGYWRAFLPLNTALLMCGVAPGELIVAGLPRWAHETAPGIPLRLRASWWEAELWQVLTLIRLGGYGEPFANAGELRHAMERWEEGRDRTKVPTRAEALARRDARRPGSRVVGVS